MKTEAMNGKLFSKFFSSVPKTIWIICASYALIIATTFLALIITLFVARVDIDDHINRYMDILLKREELKTQPNNELIKRIEELEKAKLPSNLEQRMLELESKSHNPSQ